MNCVKSVVFGDVEKNSMKFLIFYDIFRVY